MKISLNWLKEYIDIPSTPEELSEILTSLGLEVEGVDEIESVPGGLVGLVVGEVLTCGKHPNADRLSVTTVAVGGDTPLHIVCGAHNVAAGQKVVIAPVNTMLYPLVGDPFKIKKGKIRGEVSEGMICAEDEVGLGPDHDGIIELPAHLEVGSSVAAHYNIETDTIYEIGLTPNRSDATSHVGVARDLLAYYRYHVDADMTLRLPEAELKIDRQQDKQVEVEIRDAEGCPRFSGLTLSGIKISPSPEWMQQRLRAIGVRPISNVVDITNYVLHEYGQPLHAYDFDKISERRIHVQTLPKGSKFTTLDEKERSLHSEDLIVCDGADKGMCIAGVFGGQDSGVTEATTDIFLEAAHFNALQLRKTSTRHLLRTDAAKCFEKGADPAHTVTSLNRAAALLCEYADAVVSSDLVDNYAHPIQPTAITVRKNRISELIGTTLTDVQVGRIFDALDIEISHSDETIYEVHIPTNKADVTREADVIEEILRIFGFNNVPISDKLSTTIAPSQRMDKIRLRKMMSDVLVNKGYLEMMGLSLIPSAHYKSFSDYSAQAVKINNTSNIHLDIMRPEMMMSALLTCQHNINRQQKSISIFENGRSYVQTEDNEHRETEWLTITRTGMIGGDDWRQPTREVDFYDLKGAVHSIFRRLGLDKYQIDELDDQRFAYGLKFHRGPNVLVSLGQVSQQMSQAADVDQQVYYAELNMDLLLKAAAKTHLQLREILKYPSSTRDLALTLDEGVKYDAVKKIIKKSSGSLLKTVTLFDIYRDKKHLGEGKKSYAVSLTFADPEKNLKDKVIDKIMTKVIANLQADLGAKLR